MRFASSLMILAALLLGVAVGLGAYTFAYAKGYAYLTNDPQACTNCHVMQSQYDGWMKSSHHSAATCNDCHTPHNIIGKYAVKANDGFWHSLYFTTGHYPDVIEITKFNRKVTEGACRRCHENITAEIAGNPVHGGAAGLQCIRSEEHTSELQSRLHPVCRLLLEKKKHSADSRMSYWSYTKTAGVRST